MTTPNTNIAVSSREKLRNKLEVIESKLAKITESANAPYKTNGKFRFNPAYTANAPIDIFTTTDLGTLLSILSYLTGQSGNYTKAAEEVAKLKTYPIFKWLDYSYEDWKHDLLIRINLITFHEETNALKNAKKKLETFLSDEDRLEMVLNDLDKVLGTE